MMLDDNDAECHRILCEINLIRKDFDRAEYHQQRALSLNPNDPRMVAQRGYLLTCLGQAIDAVEWTEKALRLDPTQPGDFYMRSLIVLRAAGRYADAAKTFSRLAHPQFFTHAHMAACLAELNDGIKAKPHAAEVLKTRPGFSVQQYASTLPFKKPSGADHVRAGMLKAGLPQREHPSRVVMRSHSNRSTSLASRQAFLPEYLPPLERPRFCSGNLFRRSELDCKVFGGTHGRSRGQETAQAQG
jgi:adenylate cyclase